MDELGSVRIWNLETELGKSEIQTARQVNESTTGQRNGTRIIPTDSVNLLIWDVTT